MKINKQRKMTSPTQVLKSIGPKLVPFLKTSAVFFVLQSRIEKETWLYLLIKCIPILCLIMFVLLHGMSFSDEYAYSRRIILGLVFSCLGDALLVWPNSHFLYGMVAFGIAHINYVAAFGFKPINLPLGIIMYCTTIAVNSILLRELEGLLLIFVPAYSLLLTTTTWRGIAKVQLFEELWTWTKLCSCIGGISFLISDTILAFNSFYAPIPYGDELVMSTYYLAQLGITLSIVDSKDCYRAEQAKKHQMEGKTETSNVVKTKKIKEH
ncbi:lysoplasmalogenase-like protein TMEM86A [Chrysoperla carnea]|uniref:lysoplasmalogenase-like protein TMEM86A n=1 Tax=Chrysoperla carnea TaxID=189513 RepID=UPI001D094398|nr:lysoplasmalogenase-like protein TMEM86A [Chrysoperla carnea]